MKEELVILSVESASIWMKFPFSNEGYISSEEALLENLHEFIVT